MNYHRRTFKQRQHSSILVKLSLGFLITAFILFNIMYIRKLHARTSHITTSLRGKGSSNSHAWIDAETTVSFNHQQAASKAKNLIMVAGHSVLISGHLQDAHQDESDWFLLPYQLHKGLPNVIYKHIQTGIEIAASDEESLLVFSGGETRANAGPETEASSYYRVADAMRLWKGNVRARTTTEEFATDSFQNLLFSICRFYEVTGNFPQKITVVSFTFKENRFSKMHAVAIRWPAEKFVYVGVDPDLETGFILSEAQKGEFENAAKPFTTDPYGCHSEVLKEKRKERNPFNRFPPYRLSCPAMQEVLQFCGPEIIESELLPW